MRRKYKTCGQNKVNNSHCLLFLQIYTLFIDLDCSYHLKNDDNFNTSQKRETTTRINFLQSSTIWKLKSTPGHFEICQVLFYFILISWMELKKNWKYLIYRKLEELWLDGCRCGNEMILGWWIGYVLFILGCLFYFWNWL
jgi:hypothetical protein